MDLGIANLGVTVKNIDVRFQSPKKVRSSSRSIAGSWIVCLGVEPPSQKKSMAYHTVSLIAYQAI